MATFTRFEAIEGWQRARHLARTVYKLTNLKEFSRDFGLRDQVRRAAISVVANIAEGFGRGGNKEFVAFLSVARGSCVEVRSRFYFALDAGLPSEVDFSSDDKLASETEGRVSGLIKYLAASDYDGRKFFRHSREVFATENSEP